MIKDKPQIYKAVAVDISSAAPIVEGSLDEENRQNSTKRSFLFSRAFWFVIGLFCAVLTLQAFCHHRDDKPNAWTLENAPNNDNSAVSQSKLSFTSFRDHSAETEGEVPMSKYVPSHDTLETPSDSLEFELMEEEQEEIKERSPMRSKSSKSSKSRPRHHSKSRPKSHSKSRSKSHKGHSHHHPKSHSRPHPNPLIQPRDHDRKKFDEESDFNVPKFGLVEGNVVYEYNKAAVEINSSTEIQDNITDDLIDDY